MSDPTSLSSDNIQSVLALSNKVSESTDFMGVAKPEGGLPLSNFVAPTYAPDVDKGEAAQFLGGLSAAARMSPLGQMIHNINAQDPEPPDGFQYSRQDIVGYEPYEAKLAMARSRAEFIRLKSEIDQENLAKSTMGQSGLFGQIAQMGVDIIGDPFMWAMGPMGTGLRAETMLGRVGETLGQIARNDALVVASGEARHGMSVAGTDEERDSFIRTGIALNAILGGTLFAGSEALRAGKAAASSIRDFTYDRSNFGAEGAVEGNLVPLWSDAGRSDVIGALDKLDHTVVNSKDDLKSVFSSALPIHVATEINRIVDALPDFLVRNLKIGIYDGESATFKSGLTAQAFYHNFHDLVGLFTESRNELPGNFGHEIGHRLFAFLDPVQHREAVRWLVDHSGIPEKIAKEIGDAANKIADRVDAGDATLTGREHQYLFKRGTYRLNPNEMFADGFAKYLKDVVNNVPIGERFGDVADKGIVKAYKTVMNNIKKFAAAFTDSAPEQAKLINNFYENVISVIESRGDTSIPHSQERIRSSVSAAGYVETTSFYPHNDMYGMQRLQRMTEGGAETSYTRWRHAYWKEHGDVNPPASEDMAMRAKSWAEQKAEYEAYKQSPKYQEDVGRRYQEFSSGNDLVERSATAERIKREGVSSYRYVGDEKITAEDLKSGRIFREDELEAVDGVYFDTFDTTDTGGQIGGQKLGEAGNERVKTGNEQVETGIGLEKITSGMTASQRSGKWQSKVAGDVLERLVGTGGTAKQKNLASNWVESAQGILARKAVSQGPWLAEAVEGLRDSYAKFRGESADSRLTAVKITLNDLVDRVKGNDVGLSFGEYNKEVGRWADTPLKDVPEQYRSGVQHVQSFLDRYLESGKESGLWAAHEIEAHGHLSKALEEAMSAGAMDRVASLQTKLSALEAQIAYLNEHGPSIGKTPRYFPFIPDLDAIKDNPNGFINDLAKAFSKNGGADDAVGAAKKVYDKIVKQNVFSPDWERIVFPSHRTTERTLGMNIDLRDMKDWRVNDADFIMRRYQRQLGSDLALMQEFGSVSLTSEMKAIAEHYDSLADAARGADDAAKMRSIMDEKARVLEDLRNAHDTIRGTFGVPNQADSLHTGAMKGAGLLKNFAYVTMMGGAGLSSILPDLMTPVFKEGMGRFLKMGVSPLLDAEAFKAAKAEMHSIGVGLEMVLHGRGPAFIDTAMELPSTAGVYGKLNTALQYGSSLMSNMNMLNPWTAFAEVFTGTMMGNRIFQMALDHASGVKLADVDVMKLARAGISEDALGRIADNFIQHGTVRYKGRAINLSDLDAEAYKVLLNDVKRDGGLLLGNLNDWVDGKHADIVKQAIYSDTINTILRPQPGGNIPTLMSRPAFQVLMQFQSFAMASTQSILLEGLQRHDAAFWSGAAALTAAGYLTAQIKAGVNGTDWEKKPWQSKLVESIDRANLLGYATNINNVMARLSDHKLSIQAALGEQTPNWQHTPFSSKVGSILGPGAQQLARVGSVATDAATGSFNKQSAYNLMAITPLMTVPSLQAPRHDFVDSYSARKPRDRGNAISNVINGIGSDMSSIGTGVANIADKAGSLVNEGLAQAWQ